MFSNIRGVRIDQFIFNNTKMHRLFLKKLHRGVYCCNIFGSKSLNINTSQENFALNVKFPKIVFNKYVTTPTNNLVCWNCGHINDKHTNPIFCVSCNAIQRPDSEQNYFEVLGVKEGYVVDEIQLANKYKNLQRLLHPDKFGNRNKSEQEISANYSSLVNKAYSTLQQPLSRGLYMLKLQGYEIPEQTQLESKFLHEIMEKNEEVENAETPEEVLRINKENKKVLSDLSEELSNVFDKRDFDSAKNILIRMKYYVSIDGQIKAIIRKMGIVE